MSINHYEKICTGHCKSCRSELVLIDDNVKGEFCILCPLCKESVILNSAIHKMSKNVRDYHVRVMTELREDIVCNNLLNLMDFDMIVDLACFVQASIVSEVPVERTISELKLIYHDMYQQSVLRSDATKGVH